jgi:hypothetical protein
MQQKDREFKRVRPGLLSPGGSVRHRFPVLCVLRGHVFYAGPVLYEDVELIDSVEHGCHACDRLTKLSDSDKRDQRILRKRNSGR